ncbi:hypothetical protein [Neorhizobium sp. AL 9.2.2]|uniref:hypothetical protein n=1 Tax=Neorhizobium sp. AL 9.2.2 TaxID=2712894 RepID=UPI00157479E3|nr:hypothetical protein [Neorhizobium sp. AL 9.2.2]NSY17253.1 hypothetical protein [Neorhizobium sp. AL 9.2.2]
MKGIYVYGALLMAFAFATGLHLNSPLLMAGAILACAIAALGEVVTEVAGVSDITVGQFRQVQWAVSMASWLITAGVTLLAIVSLIGGI